MELLTLGVPSVIVPDTNQIEQENNASRMKDLGVSETLGYDALQNDPRQSVLHGAISTILKTPFYRQRAEVFARQAAAINGAAATADILREYAHRLTAY